MVAVIFGFFGSFLATVLLSLAVTVRRAPPEMSKFAVPSFVRLYAKATVPRQRAAFVHVTVVLTAAFVSFGVAARAAALGVGVGVGGNTRVGGFSGEGGGRMTGGGVVVSPGGGVVVSPGGGVESSGGGGGGASVPAMATR